MSQPASRALRFFLERWIQKGALHQLLLMAALISLVALSGGAAAWAATEESFASLPEAVWWAFLRLTDPGYLGDDEGATLRVISTVVTILGYVLFMGSMIAIMTQWLMRTMRVLESGLTPIRMRNHVVVLGWSNRTPEIVLTLLNARGRLARFLERRDARRLRIVVLADEVSVERRLELREALGSSWSEGQVFLRSGSALQPDHLRRLDLGRAAAVILPGADFEQGGAEATDTRVVKALMTTDAVLRDSGTEARPHIVAEVFDPLLVPLARGVDPGGVQVIASDHVIPRVLAQSVRHPGLGSILVELLSHHEDSIYVRGVPELAGHGPHTLHDAFPRAVVLGRVRGSRTELDPTDAEPLESGDLLVLLARSFDDCKPLAPPAVTTEPAPASRPAAPAAPAAPARRIAILGWSHKVGAFASELASSAGAFELTTMSRLSADEREAALARQTLDPARVRIRHVQGDYAIEQDLVALDIGAFDDVVFLASDVTTSSEDADARTVLGHALLRSLLRGAPREPQVLAELLDPDNAHLLRDGAATRVVTPQLLSYLLAHVALRPELDSVFDELFRTGGSELQLCVPDAIGLSAGAHDFRAIQAAAHAHGMVALGIRGRDGVAQLNPDRARPLRLDDGEHVVVLAPA